MEDPMKGHRPLILTVCAIGILLVLSACTESIDSYSDAAKVSGYVFMDETESQGVPGVQVLLESDPTSEVPYDGPDRWFYTDENGYFEGTLYLGSERDPVTGKITYKYYGDVAVSYYHQGTAFSWVGGATVQAGGNFICPPVNLSQFSPVGTGGG
jgi:hypothetical protein